MSIRGIFGASAVVLFLGSLTGCGYPPPISLNSPAAVKKTTSYKGYFTAAIEGRKELITQKTTFPSEGDCIDAGDRFYVRMLDTQSLQVKGGLVYNECEDDAGGVLFVRYVIGKDHNHNARVSDRRVARPLREGDTKVTIRPGY